MTALETLKDFMILLAQPRRRWSIRPGHPAFHAGDFLGDLTQFEKQGRWRFPRSHDRTAVRLTTIDELFETVAQLGGKGAQFRQLPRRQVEPLVPAPSVALGVAVDRAGADAVALGNGADRPALEIVGLDRRPIDMARGPVFAF